jgi:hypothetical protein
MIFKRAVLPREQEKSNAFPSRREQKRKPERVKEEEDAAKTEM